jgi:hypothetical protein
VGPVYTVMIHLHIQVCLVSSIIHHTLTSKWHVHIKEQLGRVPALKSGVGSSIAPQLSEQRMHQRVE